MWGRDSGEGNIRLRCLRRLEGIDGLKRIRLMYLHPHGVSDELIDSILESEIDRQLLRPFSSAHRRHQFSRDGQMGWS